MPPPMQAVASAYFPLPRLSSSAALPVMRAPEAPSGWPSAIAPPSWFTRSIGQPICSMQGMACAANASLISITSISFAVMPAFFSAFCDEEIGPSPITAGSSPEMAIDLMRARMGSLCFFAYSSEVTSTAAAPSVNGLEVAAVTLPAASKAGFSLARSSLLLLGRMMPSASTTPFLVVMGTISSFRFAAAAFLCELMANASCASRSILYFFARFSAVRPILMYASGMAA